MATSQSNLHSSRTSSTADRHVQFPPSVILLSVTSTGSPEPYARHRGSIHCGTGTRAECNYYYSTYTYLQKIKNKKHPQTRRKKERQKDIVVGNLMSQQHASVSQGRICSDNFTKTERKSRRRKRRRKRKSRNTFTYSVTRKS